MLPFIGEKKKEKIAVEGRGSSLQQHSFSLKGVKREHEPEPQEKAVLKNIYFEYKNSVIQSVAFKINYTYPIIKIVCVFFLTMCFKSSLYWNRYSVLKANKPTTVIWIWLYCWGVCPGAQGLHKGAVPSSLASAHPR